MIKFGNKKYGINFGGGKKAAKAIKYNSDTPDIEQDSIEELNEATQAFSQQAKAEYQQFKDNVDANYFTVITFNNSGQLKEFLSKIGLAPADPQYIDGRVLAKKLGIEITVPDKTAPGSFRVNSQLKDLTL